MTTVPFHYTNAKPFGDAKDAGSVRVSRRELASWLGSRCWSLYCCLALTRSRDGLVSYKTATLTAKMSEEWGKARPVSARTVGRYLRRLQDVGLVVTTGRYTSNGCRYRVVFGRNARQAEDIMIPAGVAAHMEAGPIDTYNHQEKCSETIHVMAVSAKDDSADQPPNMAVSAKDDSSHGNPHGNAMAIRMAISAIDQSADFKEVDMSSDTTKGGRDPRVGVGGDVGVRSLSKEKEITRPVTGPADFSNRENKPPASDLVAPAAFPPHPLEVIGHYDRPAKPLIRSSDSPTERVRKLINAYRGAVEWMTRKPCNAYTRGLPRQVTLQLTKAAKAFEKHRLSPHLWCVVMMRLQRLKDTDAGVEWQVPPIGRVISAGAVNKLRGMVRGHADDWNGAEWRPECATRLVRHWEDVRREIRRKAAESGATQQDLDGVVKRYLPRAKYDEVCEQARREMIQRRTQDTVNMRRGRWIW